MNFSQFKSEWLGRVIDYDHVYQFQCVDLILEYIYECYGIAGGVAGNAIDYWNRTGVDGFNQNLLNKFDKVSSTDAQEGDIVVLNGLPGNPYGHIGIATGNINATDVEILEQNGATGSGDGQGGNAIRVRYVSRSRIAGLLRPKQLAGQPTEVAPPYSIEPITPKQIKLNKNTHLWNLVYDNFTAIDNNPLADAVAGTTLTVRAILHHNIGYNYYLTDPNSASGYNTLDCDDCTPPAADPVPYVPPAGPMTLPASDTYELIREVGGYVTANMAINHLSEQVRIPAGTYYVFNRRFANNDPNDELLAVNVTKTPGKPGAWISVADNSDTPPAPAPDPEPAPPPAEEPKVVPPEPVEPEYVTSYVEHPVQVYMAMKDVPVVDVAGEHKTVIMPKYSVTKIAGTFTLNSVVYARLKTAADKGMWYAIEVLDPATYTANIELESDVFSNKTTLAERVASKTVKPIDKLALVVAHTRNTILGFVALLGKIKTSIKNKT